MRSNWIFDPIGRNIYLNELMRSISSTGLANTVNQYNPSSKDLSEAQNLLRLRQAAQFR